MVFLLMKVSGQSKYVTVIKVFVTQFSLENDQYSNNITTATDVPSDHRLDPKFYENKREKCYGDKTLNDTEDEKSTATKCSQKGIMCYCCGEKVTL